MGMQHSASNVRAPWDVGSNDFNVRKFTAGTTHLANAIPRSWGGRYVRIKVVGGNLHYGFSTNSSAEISAGVTATDAGASGTVGDYLADGELDHVHVPDFKPGESVYFVREASASCTVYMRLAEDPKKA